jgi:hypothetical protein
MANKFDEDNLPIEAFCPISSELMDQDPMITPDGTTYSREGIQEWIKQDGTNPRTREPLSNDDLIPNRALLSMIQHWTAQQTPGAFNKHGASKYDEWSEYVPQNSGIPSSTAPSFGDTSTKTDWFTTVISFLMSSPGYIMSSPGFSK